MRRRVGNTSAKFRMACWSIFIFVGVITAVVSFLLLLGNAVDKRRCTEQVTAVVVDNELVVLRSNLRSSSRSSSRSRGPRITYAPILEYEYHGETYRHKSSMSSNPPRFQIGQRVALMIDPNDPATAYDKSGAANVACFIAMGASAIFLFLGIFGVSLNVKRIKQNKGDYIPPSHSNWN